MVKRKIFFVFAALLASALILGGCTKSELNKYSASISELREYIYCAENDSYKVSAISGVREEPYELDGISGNKRNFTVVTVTPKSFDPGKAYKYSVKINETEYEGDLMPHPFAQSLSVDVPALATQGFDFTVVCGASQTLNLVSAVTGENIGAEKAFNIALNKLKPELKSFKVKGKLNAEIYVRIMENPIDGSGGSFWYVSFVSQDKTTVAVLLKADTGEVAALRT